MEKDFTERMEEILELEESGVDTKQDLEVLLNNLELSVRNSIESVKEDIFKKMYYKN